MWQEALRELERLRSLPAVARSRWRARIYFGMERYEEVVRLAREGGPGGSMCGWLACAYAALGRHREARRVAGEAVALRGRAAAGAMGYVLMAAGDPAAAIPWYDRAALDPSSRPAALWKLGHLLTVLGDYREAAAALESAIRAASYLRYEDARELARCWRHLGREHDADLLEQLAADRERAESEGSLLDPDPRAWR
jgi:tetratricopeptide (TPR) repeat protein